MATVVARNIHSCGLAASPTFAFTIVNAGAQIVVQVQSGQTHPVTAISDTGANVWTAQPALDNGALRQITFTCIAKASGSTTITLTNSGGSELINLVQWEIVGGFGASLIRASAHAQGTTSTAANSGTTGTATAIGDVVLGVVGWLRSNGTSGADTGPAFSPSISSTTNQFVDNAGVSANHFSLSASDAVATSASTEAFATTVVSPLNWAAFVIIISSRSSVDTAGGTDSARVSGTPLRATDTAGGTDSASSRRRLALDTAGGSDVATETRNVQKTAADTLGGTDVAVKGPKRTASDTAGVTDVATRITIQARTALNPYALLNEDGTYLLNENGGKILLDGGSSNSYVDVVGGTDSAHESLTQTTADTAGGTDVATRAGEHLARTNGDTAGGTDAASKANARFRTASDTAGGTDSAVRSFLVRGYLSDSNNAPFGATNFEIFIADDAGNKRWLTNDPAYDSWWPRLSPDGTTIMFMRTTAGDHDNTFVHASLWTIKPDGTGLTQRIANPAAITMLAFAHPDWSPLGDEIVMFAFDATNNYVLVLSTTTWAVTKVPNGVGNTSATFGDPSFNPSDHTQLVMTFHPIDAAIWTSIAGHYLIGSMPNGAFQQSFTTILDNGTTPTYDPVVSPDGSRVAWEQDNGSTIWSIKKMNWPSGTAVADVVHDANINTVPRWRDNVSMWFHRWIAPNYPPTVQPHVYSVWYDGTQLTDTGVQGEFPDSFPLPMSIRSTSDVAGGSDVATRLLAMARATVDTAGATDAAGGLTLRSRTSSDIAGGSDSASRITRMARSAVDTAGGIDSTTRILATQRAGSDVVGGTEVATKTAGSLRTGSDVVGGSDTASRVVVETRTANDIAGGTDSAGRLTSKTRIGSDTAGATDVATRSLLVFSRSTSDVVGGTDAAIEGARLRTGFDTAGGSDAATRALRITRVDADTAGGADTVVRQASIQRGSADVVGVTDSASGAGRFFLRVVADTAGVVDATTDHVGASRFSVDVAGVVDSATWILRSVRFGTDAAGGSDSASGSLATGGTSSRVAADSAGGFDGAGRLVRIGRASIDVAGATESAIRLLSAARICSDKIGVYDSNSHLLRVVTDVAGGSDVATARTGFTKEAPIHIALHEKAHVRLSGVQDAGKSRVLIAIPSTPV